MKLLVCTLLLLAIHGLCYAQEYDENDFEETKYGLGFNIGGSYKGGLELGARAGDDAGSLFLNKDARVRANGGLGVYKSFKPYDPNPQPQLYNGYPVPFDPRLTAPPGYPNPQQQLNPTYPVQSGLPTLYGNPAIIPYPPYGTEQDQASAVKRMVKYY